MAITTTGLDQARQFIARVLPVPNGNYIGIHNTWMPKNHKPNEKLPWGNGGVASNNLVAVEIAQGIQKGKNNRDIYVCMGIQERYKEKINRRSGHVEVVPDKHQANIVCLRSLYIDSDFKGGDHGYPSQADADAALAAFLSDVGLPPPNVMVATGGGYHIYWVLNTVLPRDDWQPIANALAEATRVHGFKCDTNVTVDSSRVLRIPGTQNFKYDPPRSVALHEWLDNDYDVSIFDSIVTKYGTRTIVNRALTINSDFAILKGEKPFTTFQSAEEITELGAGIDAGGPPINVHRIHPECGFIKEALVTHGKDYDQSLWNVTTLLSVFMQSGRPLAHIMSNGHPEYQQSTTDMLFDRKDEERQHGLGWPSCKYIATIGAKPCQTCKHLKDGLYPFSFLTPDPALQTYASAPQMAVGSVAQPVGDILPDDYYRDARGWLFYEHEDKEGNKRVITPLKAAFYNPHLSLKFKDTELSFDVKVAEHISQRHITMPLSCLNNVSTSLGNILGEAGIVVENLPIAKAMLMAWVTKLKEHENTSAEMDAFGWVDKDNKPYGFAYNRTIYSKNGEERTKSASSVIIAKHYNVSGSLEEWKKAALAVTNTKRPAIDAIIAAAFAAPLIKFSGERGVYLNVFSMASGIGKTTAMRVSQAVWADPLSAMQGLKDTGNSVNNKLGELRHLPVFWDELKGEAAFKRMAEIIFELAGGKEKARLDANVQQRDVKHWHTMLVTASNDSMSEHINELAKGNEAGFFRLFELEAKHTDVGRLSQAEADLYTMTIDRNYGHAGQVYSKFLGENADKVARDVNLVVDKFQFALNTDQAERFWLHAAACLYLGAVYANKLELTQIDTKALREALFEKITSMRDVLISEPLNSSEPIVNLNALANYLSDNSRHVLRTNILWDAPGKPPHGVVKQEFVSNERVEGCTVQFASTTSTLRMAVTPLKAWIIAHKISFSTFQHAMSKHYGMTLRKATLAAGVPGLRTHQQSVFDIDCSRYPDLSTMMEVLHQQVANVVAFQKP